MLLGGRAVLHFSTDVPYDQLFGQDNALTIVFGVILIAFTFLSVLPNTVLRRSKIVYAFVVPSVILLFQTLGSFVKAGYVPEQIIEHALQIMLPLLLIFVSKVNYQLKQLYYPLAICTGLTFVGHGLYAIGIHFVPENFIEMTMNSLLISKENATQFLQIMGWLDLICVAGAFIPFVRRYVGWYLIVWGILTAMARVYFVLNLGITADLFLVNFPNMVYRLPHGIVPVLMLIIAYKLDNRSREKV